MAVHLGSETIDLTEMADHEALATLLPEIGKEILSTERAIGRLEEDVNWMPAAIDPEKQVVHFVNLGGFDIGDEPFMTRLKDIVSIGRGIEHFSTSIDVLARWQTDTP